MIPPFYFFYYYSLSFPFSLSKNILQIYNFDVTAKRFLTKCLLQNVQITLRKLGRTIEALPNAQTAENAELNSNNLEQNLVLPHSSLKESNIQKTGV